MPIQDLVGDRIGEYLDASWDMGKDDDFKLSHEQEYTEIFSKDKWVEDTKDIVNLRHK